MNLFVTHPSPSLSAQALDDRRMIKAVLETAQLLSTACGCGYKPTHIHHPVTRWVSDPTQGPGLPNLTWTFAHFQALSAEYTFRFGKTHKSILLLPELIRAAQNLGIGFCPGPESFQNSARNASQGLDFTHLPVPDSYREYMRAKWTADGLNARWSHRGQPEWR